MDDDDAIILEALCIHLASLVVASIAGGRWWWRFAGELHAKTRGAEHGVPLPLAALAGPPRANTIAALSLSLSLSLSARSFGDPSCGDPNSKLVWMRPYREVSEKKKKNRIVFRREPTGRKRR